MINPWFSIARSVLIAIGSVLVTLGYTDAGTVEQVVGAILVVASALWGVKEKFEVNKIVEVQERTLAAKEQRIENLEQSKTGY